MPGEAGRARLVAARLLLRFKELKGKIPGERDQGRKVKVLCFSIYNDTLYRLLEPGTPIFSLGIEPCKLFSLLGVSRHALDC